MNTLILYGDRGYSLSAIASLRLQPVDCPQQKLDKPENFEVRWRQLRPLKPERLVFIDPPNTPPKGLKPRPFYFVFFTDKVPAAWERWAKANAVTVKGCVNPTEDQVVDLLTHGVNGVSFTTDAANWYARTAGTSMVRLLNEVAKCKLMGFDIVGRDDAVRLIGGEADARADEILRSLGTERSLVLMAQIKDKDAKALQFYFNRALAGRRNGWRLALNALFDGADKKRYDYWTAAQLFAQHCYQAKKKGEPAAALTTFEIAGTVCWYTPACPSSTST